MSGDIDVGLDLGHSEDHKTWTDKFAVIYGGYRWLNSYPIHYFMGSFSIKDLWDNVTLMGEMKEVEKWGFEALFQRNINNERVDAIVSKYLSNDRRVKFFPPITLALMPCKDFALSQDYGNHEITPHREDKRIELHLNGLRIHYQASSENTQETSLFPKSGSFCRIEWDTGSFSALAIDGQHRVEALRRFVQRTQSDSYLKDVPVILLFVDPSWLETRNLLQVTREIFIDINKNARQVDDSRLILLDDRNFYHVLTRQLVCQAFDDSQRLVTPTYETAFQYTDRSDSSLKLIKTGIPQELVDVTMGKDAPDIQKLKPWQLTSAFILNRAIKYGFFFKDQWDEFEKILETSEYKETSSVEYEIAVAEKRALYSSENVEDSESKESASISESEMLSFNPDITKQLVDNCLKLHGVLLRAVYTSFAPYKEFIQKFLDVCSDTNAPDTRLLLIAEGGAPGPTPSYETSIAKQLSADQVKFKACKNLIGKIARPSGWDGSLVWYSVFQMAVLMNLRMLKTYILKIFPLENKNKIVNSKIGIVLTREVFAEIYIKELDYLYSIGVFEKGYRVGGFKLWHGICLKGAAGDSMDGSLSAAIRTSKLIHFLVCASYLKNKVVSDSLEKTFERIGCATGEIVTGYTNVLIEEHKARHPTDAITKELREQKKEESKKRLVRIFEQIAKP